MLLKESARELRKKVVAPLPKVSLPELLIEVDSWKGTREHFTHSHAITDDPGDVVPRHAHVRGRGERGASGCADWLNRAPSTGGTYAPPTLLDRCEAVFAPVRARLDISKGPGSRQASLSMIFKLMEAAEGRWRKLTGVHPVALVRAVAEFKNGELVEGTEQALGVWNSSVSH